MFCALRWTNILHHLYLSRQKRDYIQIHFIAAAYLHNQTVERAQEKEGIATPHTRTAVKTVIFVLFYQI